MNFVVDTPTHTTNVANTSRAAVIEMMNDPERDLHLVKNKHCLSITLHVNGESSGS